MRPLVSVIIPTHGRPECAVSTIRAVLAASDELEVVVSDTSSEDKISPEFAGKDIPRLKLLRPGEPLSVVDNFNFALGHATGEYLVFIGDDDLVSAQIAEIARWGIANHVDAFSFTFPMLYYWPTFSSTTRWKAEGSTLVISEFGGRVTPFDAKAELSVALRNMGGGVLGMPRAYAGMISRQLVERIVATHGGLFGGVSPDIYSAALISLESRKSYRVDFPIVVPGACAGSTSGKSAQGRHVGGLRDNPHIGAFKNLVWDARVPEYYSVPTVWGYSLLKGIEDKPQWLRKADFSMLYLRCLISDPQYKGMVMQCMLQHARENGYVATAFEFLGAMAREATRIGRSLVQRQLKRLKPDHTIVLRDVLNTEQAFSVASQHIQKMGKKLELTQSDR
ncbi:glycosyltransferase like 2 family protein [Ralstonia insidiosa]|uniref:Glycosyltransferase like 2 family protein n=1 Tax=Ralstonia insidiosa TaxID=190721 RepID=A0AAC9FRJ0_9RALS|nr:MULTISPECIES: glycosyltransferase [Ralstonia]ANH73912.1 glycosyltransferase like 2 family protein [Ralstonia insidiosa]MBY4706687.1 glycosyltransferase [Ralstonia insidiosa]GAQ27756.1 putative Glycosyl transferase, family 2 [Ralstonia sp. NT80]